MHRRKAFRGTLASGLLLATSFLTPSIQAHETTVTSVKTELLRPGATYGDGKDRIDSRGRPPLYEGLGSYSLPITTHSAEARAYFDQGWRLAWAFNHSEALRAFREAQRLDPGCAMCFWGEAFVLGPNLNDIMHEEAIAPAFAALQKALALRNGASAKERALIEALAARYAPDATADRAALDHAWAEAMRKVARTYPDDPEILVLAADAMMNTQPWDYWEADGRTPKGFGGNIVEVLERALSIAPDHPAAAHLYIHAVEASAEPGRAEPVADRLRGAAPAAGHLVHMPAHIYVRLGRHGDSIAVNRDAVAADEAFLAAAGDAASPIYRLGYYPHNTHFLLASAQMAGLRADVIAASEKLAAVTADGTMDSYAWIQAMKTAPYAAHAQFSAPETILALPAPDDALPFVKGFWHYARGTALARRGDLQAAAAETAAIERLIAEADMRDLEAQHLPARDVLGIARHVVEARIAQARGDYEAAERHLHEAIALQDAVPYMEPPYWYYPVRQTLGAVLLQQGRPGEAVAVFRAALKEAPRNGWALWGLLQAQLALGDPEAAATRAALAEAWLGDDDLLQLDRL